MKHLLLLASSALAIAACGNPTEPRPDPLPEFVQSRYLITEPGSLTVHVGEQGWYSAYVRPSAPAWPNWAMTWQVEDSTIATVANLVDRGGTERPGVVTALRPGRTRIIGTMVADTSQHAIGWLVVR